MADKCDYVAEIAAKRERGWLDPTVAPDRIRRLQTLFKQVQGMDSEILRHGKFERAAGFNHYAHRR
jgi:hypothetical protein